MKKKHMIKEILKWVRQHHHHHHFRPVAGRFAGAYWTNPLTGAITVALQQVPSNTAITAPLIFVDASNATGPGPKGTVSVSDGSTATLSGDGQAVNYTTGAPGLTVTITWSDPANKIPSFTVDLTDLPIPFVPVSGSFGTFVAGTTP